jgi:integrase
MADNYVASANDKRKMLSAWTDLKDSTREDYKSLASHFYNTKMDAKAITPKGISNALRACSGEYRPNYWRKLRNALMYDQVDKGHFDTALRLKGAANLSTSGKRLIAIKQKQKRCKSIDDKDLEKLYTEALRKSDAELGSALAIALYTGCRPAEMAGIRRISEDQIFIEGAKKSKGERGLDRTIVLDVQKCNVIEAAVATLQAVKPSESGTMHKVQSRLDRLTKKLWPRRKARPTLYTLRHQMGSDLKSGDLSRVEIAYVMGHQSTKSVDVYGDRRKGSRRGGVKPAPGADLSVIRANHDATPGPKSKVSVSHSPGLSY